MIFSIVICTYNPEKRLLERALNSCTRQIFSRSEYEIIVVDNNSEQPLSEQDYIIALSKTNSISVLSEKKQGLAFARLCGIKHAKAGNIVFVDDDNELDPTYLENMALLITKHPEVSIWGPGIITLDYIDGVPAWIKDHFSYMYQQKQRTEVKFGSAIEWQDYYPAGSGLTVSKKVLEKYKTDFEEGKLTATGRKGKSMASAEDAQIIWTAIKSGTMAGTSPTLKLIHIIPKKRTTLDYLVKLNYGISYSYYTALKEMFPGHNLPYRKHSFLNRLALVSRSLLRSSFNPVLCYRKYKIENAWLKGFDDFISLQH